MVDMTKLREAGAGAGARLNMNLAKGPNVLEIPLAKITPNPNNPRREFDQEELQALAATIEAYGVMQPIGLTKPDAKGMHTIRFGERRFRASQLAGKATIPAIIADIGDERTDVIKQVIENDQRAPLSAWEMAQVVKHLLDDGMSQADIARAFGRGKGLISRYAAIANLPQQLEAVAPFHGVKFLTELISAWRSYPAQVEAYIAASPPETLSSLSLSALTASWGGGKGVALDSGQNATDITVASSDEPTDDQNDLVEIATTSPLARVDAAPVGREVSRVKLAIPSQSTQPVLETASDRLADSMSATVPPTGIVTLPPLIRGQTFVHHREHGDGQLTFESHMGPGLVCVLFNDAVIPIPIAASELIITGTK